MPETVKHPCQVVVVRYGPIASGEALNVGVVVLSQSARFMGARFVSSWDRVTAAFPDVCPLVLQRTVAAIERYCEAYSAGEEATRQATVGGIEQAFDAVLPRMDAALFRSDAMSGISGDLSHTLHELFEGYVAVRSSRVQRACRSDDDVWRSVSAHLATKNVLGRMEPRRVGGRHYAIRLEHAWQNGRWNVVRALSLDLPDPEEIGTKAADWTGRITALGLDHGVEIHLVIGMPGCDAPEDVKVAAAHAEALLREQLEATGRAAIVREDSAEAFAERIAKELRDHEAAE